MINEKRFEQFFLFHIQQGNWFLIPYVVGNMKNDQNRLQSYVIK